LLETYVLVSFLLSDY